MAFDRCSLPAAKIHIYAVHNDEENLDYLALLKEKKTISRPFYAY
jgi:hypothetical protein